MILVAPTAFNEAKLCNSCLLAMHETAEHYTSEKHQPEYSSGLYKFKEFIQTRGTLQNSKAQTDPTTALRRASQEFPTKTSTPILRHAGQAECTRMVCLPIAFSLCLSDSTNAGRCEIRKLQSRIA